MVDEELYYIKDIKHNKWVGLGSPYKIEFPLVNQKKRAISFGAKEIAEAFREFLLKDLSWGSCELHIIQELTYETGYVEEDDLDDPGYSEEEWSEIVDKYYGLDS